MDIIISFVITLYVDTIINLVLLNNFSKFINKKWSQKYTSAWLPGSQSLKDDNFGGYHLQAPSRFDRLQHSFKYKGLKPPESVYVHLTSNQKSEENWLNSMMALTPPQLLRVTEDPKAFFTAIPRLYQSFVLIDCWESETQHGNL